MIPWRRKRQPTLVSLPRKSHGQRSLVGCSPWSRKESGTTEHLTLTSLLTYRIKSGLLSHTQKWIIQRDTHADKARDFIGKGCLGGEQESKGTQEDCCKALLKVSGFIVMGLVPRLSLASYSLFWLRVLPGSMQLIQPRWIPARRILEGC